MRNRYILLGDVLVLTFATYAAFAMRFDWRFYQYRTEFFPYLAAALIVRPLVFYAFGLYQRVWRYAGVAELVAVALAVALSSVVLAAAVAAALIANRDLAFARAIIPIDALIALVLTGGLRMSARIVADMRRTTTAAGAVPPVHVLIAGAGDAGVMVLRELERNPQLGMSAVGFLDDDPAKVGKRIHTVPVLGDLRSLVRVAERDRIDEVIIAMPTAGGQVVRAVAESCRVAGLKSRTIPGFFELLGGQVSVSRLRQVEITDLLRRAPIGGKVAPGYLKGERVLVTGGGGSIGSELCRQVAASNPSQLVLLGHGENSLFETHLQLRESFPHVSIDVALADIRDRDRLTALFRRHRPTVVFHAAAHKHVPLVEDNPEEAISNNVVGTANVVDASRAVGVGRFVLISTDKAVSPTNLMGASKRLAELVVKDAASREPGAYVTVRFGNVLGSRGSVVPLFKRQIERGGPITITHPEMRRFFMTIPEAVHLVVEAGGIGRGADLFVLDMGTPVRIVDLARDLVTLSGLTPEDVPIEITGMRPGEKLDEALWEEGASVHPTECPGVLRVSETSSFGPFDGGLMIRNLTMAAGTGRRLDIEAELARWVPTYVPASLAAWTPQIN